MITITSGPDPRQAQRPAYRGELTLKESPIYNDAGDRLLADICYSFTQNSEGMEINACTVHFIEGSDISTEILTSEVIERLYDEESKENKWWRVKTIEII